MTEQELRALVREAIARQVSAPGGVTASLDRVGRAVKDASFTSPPSLRLRASHAMFTLPSGADTDGPCLIESAVPCNHCGYCRSYGH